MDQRLQMIGTHVTRYGQAGSDWCKVVALAAPTRPS
jgi:hypothetical protein